MVQAARPADPQRDRANETVIEGQKQVLELAVNGAPLPQILDVLVRTIEAQSTSGVLGSILLLDEDGAHLRLGAAPSLPEAYNQAIDGIAIGPGVGSCGTAAYTRTTVVVSDIAVDPLWREYARLAQRHGLAACWSTPILSSQGEVLATFALYHRVVATPSQRDREIVELLGGTAALVIERDRAARGRARAEAALKATTARQAARVRAMFAHAPAGIALLRGPTYVVEVANPGYLALSDHRPILGRPLRDALPEVEAQAILARLDEVRATGLPHVGRSQPLRVTRRGGEPEDAYVDLVYQPVPGPDGAIEDILVVAFEVTATVTARLAADAARARAEASERGLRTFIDSVPELAWTARPDGFVDYYNRRWYEYTGASPEAALGWGWQALHDPARLPDVLARWRRSLATGEPFEMEYTLRGADGVSRWFLSRVTPTHDADGAIVRWFGTNTNIDALKASQALTEAMAEQSRQAQAALLELRAAKERAETRLAELERGQGG